MKTATLVLLVIGGGSLLARPSNAQGEVPVAIPRASAAPTDAEQRAANRKYMAVVREEVERSKAARNPREVIIHARSSYGYGCSCIPFMFDPIVGSGEDGFWPRYGSVPQMPTGLHGPFRLTGHFEPELKNGYQVWGPDAPSANDEDPSAAMAPVFAVSAWCWDLTNRQVPDVAAWQIDDVKKMVDENNVCASAAQMKLLRRKLKRAKARSR
jgi:hypothetical protein